MAGLFGVGGYAAALIHLQAGVSPLLSIVLGGLTAGFLACLIGMAVLQLRGMYFAIVTLALAEIFRVIIRNFPDLTGGPEGTVLSSAIFAGNSTKTYWLVLPPSGVPAVAPKIFRPPPARFPPTPPSVAHCPVPVGRDPFNLGTGRGGDIAGSGFRVPEAADSLRPSFGLWTYYRDHHFVFPSGDFGNSRTKTEKNRQRIKKALYGGGGNGRLDPIFLRPSGSQPR